MLPAPAERAEHSPAQPGQDVTITHHHRPGTSCPRSVHHCPRLAEDICDHRYLAGQEHEPAQTLLALELRAQGQLQLLRLRRSTDIPWHLPPPVTNQGARHHRGVAGVLPWRLQTGGWRRPPVSASSYSWTLGQYTQPDPARDEQLENRGFCGDKLLRGLFVPKLNTERRDVS